MRDRYFTLEEANALLPWLEENLQRLMPVRNELEREQGDLLTLLRQRRGNGSSSSDREIGQKQRAVDRLTQQLQGELRVISERGILVRDLSRGLVDFPSLREGREVFLCWIRGELEISYWHETNTGFPGRQPL